MVDPLLPTARGILVDLFLYTLLDRSCNTRNFVPFKPTSTRVSERVIHSKALLFISTLYFNTYPHSRTQITPWTSIFCGPRFSLRIKKSNTPFGSYKAHWGSIFVGSTFVLLCGSNLARMSLDGTTAYSLTPSMGEPGSILAPSRGPNGIACARFGCFSKTLNRSLHSCVRFKL